VKKQRNSHGHLPPRIHSVRPLTEADLEHLRKPVARTSLQTIRESHHIIARAMASGLKLREISDLTGYSIGRLGLLARDPTMQELVTRYRDALTEDWRESQDAMMVFATRNMLAAERQLADKLDAADAEGELLPTRELLAITSDRMDRFGYGKKNMNVNVNVDFAAKLEAAIARTRKVAAE